MTPSSWTNKEYLLLIKCWEIIVKKSIMNNRPLPLKEFYKVYEKKVDRKKLPKRSERTAVEKLWFLKHSYKTIKKFPGDEQQWFKGEQEKNRTGNNRYIPISKQVFLAIKKVVKLYEIPYLVNIHQELIAHE